MDILGPVIAGFIGLIGTILALYFNIRSKNRIEALRAGLNRIEKSEELKKRYSNPLLKAAQELHDKLNDIVRNKERVLGYFKDFSKRMQNIQSLEAIIENPETLYLTHLLYTMGRYFATIEVIKKNFGLLPLAKPEDTKALNLRIKQTVAVFFSNRLHRNINIKEPHILYQGKILEGAQVIMGEKMLNDKDNPHDCISYSDFCQRLASDKDYHKYFSYLINFFNELKLVEEVSEDSKGVDFRWFKLIFFAFFLRELTNEIDSSKAVLLLPETAEYKNDLLRKNPTLQKNFEYFLDAYPDPDSMPNAEGRKGDRRKSIQPGFI